MESGTKKHFLKKLFFPVYQKVISLLIRDLHINLRNTELNNIKSMLNEQNNKLTLIGERLDMQNKQIYTINNTLTILNSLYLDINCDESDTTISTQNLKEISRVINSAPIDHLSIISYISQISKNDKNYFKNKSVCVIGKSGDIFYQELKKKNVKNFFNIELVSIQKSKNKIKQNDFEYESIKIFPTQLDSFDLKSFDVILVPDENISSLMLQKYSYNFSEKIKDSVFLTLWVLKDSLFTSKINQPGRISNENLDVYDDNFLRNIIHNIGFFEIECVYTECKGVDSYFDKKISHFSYKYGYRIIKNNSIKKTSFDKNNHAQYIKKIYVARKIPLHIKQ